MIFFERILGMKEFDLLIDLGTTTIASVLYDFSREKCTASDLSLNPQRAYGTDVISRMEASMAGSDDDLARVIRDHLTSRVTMLCDQAGVSADQIRRIMIAGNTTMIYLFMRYSCESLSKSPFVPDKPLPEGGIFDPESGEFIFGEKADDRVFFSPDDPNSFVKVEIIPWSSAFIGGDIVSGLMGLSEEFSDDKTVLFIDLGTNGEMVLSHGGKMFAAATAAGPAFEGGGLSCGTGAIPGAISGVKLYQSRPALTTIKNSLPVGICGSGAISIVSELVDKGYVNPDSSLNPIFPEGGLVLTPHAATPEKAPIIFTADDLHSVLLAKAAVAAGIDTLMKAAVISAADVDRVILAGSFGNNIDLNACEKIHLFSAIPVSVVECVGNSCLNGLMKLSSLNEIKMPKLYDINLGKSDYFKDMYLKRI